MCPSRIKSDFYPSILRKSYRKLHLISIMIRIIHAADRLHESPCILDSADTFQTILHLVPLIVKLFLIVHVHQHTATTLSCLWAHGIHTVWGWFQDFLQPSIRIPLFNLYDSYLNLVSDYCILHKNCHTCFRLTLIYMSDTLAVIADVLNYNLIYVILLHTVYSSVSATRCSAFSSYKNIICLYVVQAKSKNR